MHLWIFVLPLLFPTPSNSAYLQPDKYVTVDGLQIHYRVQGKGDPVVFIHGFGGSTFSWRHQLDKLSKHYRVFAVDIQGFGFSAKPKQSKYYSLSRQGKTVVGFMDQVKVKKAHIVGHSMGGGIAAQVALAHPQRVQSLTLVAGAVAYPRKNARPRQSRRSSLPPQATRAFQGLLQVAVRLSKVSSWFIEKFIQRSLRNMVGNKKIVTPDMAKGYVRPFLTPGFVDALFARTRAPRTATKSPQSITVPTFIVWGDRDTAVPLSFGKKLGRDIKGAKIVVYKGIGHLPAEEVPTRFNRDLKKFFQGVKKSAR